MTVTPPIADGPATSSRAEPTPRWRDDLQAGLLVSLIALPLCLGIAVASGFPPIAGVLTAIIGGLVATHLGSAPMTIKGPAAGLIVIVAGAVNELGGGDATVGYRATLAVGVVAAAVQIALALGRAGAVADLFPTSVLQGLLAAIGVILLSRQAHVLVGVTPTAREPLALLAEIPRSLAHANLPVAAIALVAGAILAIWPHVSARVAGGRAIPPALVAIPAAVALGAALGLTESHPIQFAGATWTVGPKLLVQLPARLGDAVVTPNFSQITSATSMKYIVTLALVGTIESLLSARAVDALDPWRRRPDLSRDLLAVGVGNLAAAAIGGLPMISEVVRSSANAAAGGRTRWANFVHGLALLAFVALLPAVIHHVPLAALAALLVHTAIRLASPTAFRAAWHVGPEQLAAFLATLVTTLATDVMIGVAVGLAVNAAVCVAYGAPLRSFLWPRVDVTRGEDGAVVRVRGLRAPPGGAAACRRQYGVSSAARIPVPPPGVTSARRPMGYPAGMSPLARLASACTALAIPFRITGGLAARAYGSPRPLADIDVDLCDADVATLAAALGGTVTFGPARYRSDEWDLWLCTLQIDGQEVDLCGAETARYRDRASGGWRCDGFDPRDVAWHAIDGVAVPVVPRAALVHYKRALARDVDLEDVAAITRASDPPDAAPRTPTAGA